MELWQLQQLQALPLEVKIRKTEERIKEWYEYFDGQVYVSRSGGKDSDVLGHIVKRLYPDVPHVFVNTGLEYDSVRTHAIKECDTILKPEMNFIKVITEYGYPIISKEISKRIKEYRNMISSGNDWCLAMDEFNGTRLGKNGKSLYNKSKWKFLIDAPFRISDNCCNSLKKKPVKNYEIICFKKPIIGTMASESMSRRKSWIKSGCNGFENSRPVSNPISFWTEQDILKYIKLYDLEIAEVYGDVVYMDSDGMEYQNSLFDLDMKLVTTGESRTGCVFCMFGVNQDKERFLRLREIDIKKYNFVMNGGEFDEEKMWVPNKDGLGYKFIIDWLNRYGDLGIKY